MNTKSSNPNMNKLIILFAGLIFLSITIFFIISKADLAKDPELIKVKDITLVSIDDSLLSLTVTMVISNDNSFSANISNIDSLLFMDNQLVGTVKDTQNRTLIGSGLPELTIPAKIDLAKFSKIIPNLLEKKTVSVVVKGLFEVNALSTKLILERSVETHLSLTSEVNKIVNKKLNQDALSLDSVNIESIDFFNLAIGLGISMNNYFSIDFVVDSINCDLYLKGTENAIGRWRYDGDELKVEANSTKKINGQAEVLNENIVAQISTTVFGAKNVVVKGTAKIKLAGYSFTIPIDQTVTVKGILDL